MPALMRALLDDVRAAAGRGARPAGAAGAASRPPSARAPAGAIVFLLNHGARTVEVGLPAPMRDALAADRTGGAGAGPVERVTLGARGVAVLTEPGA